MLEPTTPQDSKAAALLEDAYVIWLTTVRPSGQPQSSPVWFVVDDDEFLVFSLDGTARTKNIRRNDRVSLNLDSNAGADVVAIEGVARIVDGPSSLDHEEYQRKYADGMTRIGHTPTTFSERYPVAIKIEPVRWRVH